MTHCIALHSYKGGTGKTTIAANIAAILAKSGKKVALLDLDIYAPSLHTYFKITPDKWINDFLDNNADLDETVLDVTDSIYDEKPSLGKLYLGFSNPNRDAIFKFEISNGTEYWKKQFRKLVFLREQMITKLGMDYIILDTSPGIRHWSINALSIADKLILTMKMDDLDIEGTRKLLHEIYTTFVKFGAISYILLNRVSGYCVPMPLITSIGQKKAIDPANTQIEQQQQQFDDNNNNIYSHSHHHQQQQQTDIHNPKKILAGLQEVKGVGYLTPLPCYCDIQFSPREFLTAINKPDHLFSKNIQAILDEITQDNDQ
jgi:MinD-like ATPase involved in chromosome partitioning or flagellar assembly